ncbi:uncharacterized protein AB675_10137 [Cyphellophora attinorum]|uniref:Methyltransferase domain-containing protein n=1 Tax=Cyphellophora attinorum TaxID=1664694 RepID=A0A0N1NW09_9EURO|nr:uncharacterized protein AB675_10137 [Phialophora attinorum]KPI35196.1 hypothetical protein AB675_10137 [Phialophora attinorum]
MSGTSALQNNYDDNARAYNQFLATPLGTLEAQLFELCIPPCKDCDVLDLGGGTGLGARDAINAGARHVDVIDISPEMMRQGQDYERSIGRSDAIDWHQADVSQSLDRQLDVGRLGPYDMVIANGIFDHAQSKAELRAMWANAARFLKPGGRVVANRNDPFSQAVGDGVYGVKFTDFERLENDEGWRYTYRVVDTDLVFESYALDCYVNDHTEVAREFCEDFETVRWEKTAVVRSDMAFWATYLQHPILYIFTATKRS